MTETYSMYLFDSKNRVVFAAVVGAILLYDLVSMLLDYL